ncbi:uncharacterized protein LOC135212631 [Macrobrachium nipponense]|uniref:uncharacterized protein LOC135212631 n=1 Tax=Macrobrachium nipponense TaxID=159736 RepID=UPI0030C8563C
MAEQSDDLQVNIKEEVDDEVGEEGFMTPSSGGNSGSPLDTKPSILLPKGAMRGNGRFMDAFRVFQVMLHKHPSGTSVPDGTKENVYFLLNNEINMARRGKGKLCRYLDDCGAWSVNASCKSHHYVIRGEQLDNVDLKAGLYCKELKGLKVPLDPQPSDDELITFKRYYVSLKRSPTYRKRVSTVAKCPNSLAHLKSLAVIEYIGLFHTESEPAEDPLALSSKNNVNDKVKLKCTGFLTPPKYPSCPESRFMESNEGFLATAEIFHVMLTKEPIGQDIPAGIKEDVYFLLDNGQNINRRASGKRSRYWDDCGHWSVNGKSKYLNFAIRNGKHLCHIEIKDGHYSEIVEGARIPLVPQPTDDNLISFRQYFVNLKEDASYRKRVSLVTKCPESLAHLKNLAVVEYLGKWPIPAMDPRPGNQSWNQTSENKEEFVVCSPDIHSFDMDKSDAEKSVKTDEITLENGRFLSADGVFHVMLFRRPVGDSVPQGAKENVCFLIDNGQNITRKANGKKSRYSDDYGIWSVRPSSDTDYYLIRDNGHLCFMSLVDGVYCNLSKGEHVPLDPQPTNDNIIVFSRYRASLKGDPDCRKRISTVLKCPDSMSHMKSLAVVEYIRSISKVQNKDNNQIFQEGSSDGKNMICSSETVTQNDLPPISSKYVVPNHCRFLDGNTIYRFFLHGKPVSTDALKGRKENLYFLCYIDSNLVTETGGKKCPYTDECGPWIAKPSCKTHRYIVCDGEELDFVDMKDGIYCREIKGVRIPVEPQPNEEEIITFKRYYGYLKRNPNYKRRVSIVLNCSRDRDHLRKVAVVEYIGSFYG